MEDKNRTKRTAKPDSFAMALRDTEERLRGILQTAVEGIITVDEWGKIESVNPAALKLFGYAAADMIGRNVSMLMPEPYASEHDKYLSNYIRTGKGKIIGIGREVTGMRKDRSLFPMDLSVGEVQLSGERFFTGIVRNITERKRLEKEILEISDREQRRIGHDLHDDLCQHLAGIGLMSEVLEQKLTNTAPNEAAEARRIAERVREAIEQTRMLARGLSPLEKGSADLPSALNELAVNITSMFPVRCAFRADPSLVISDADVCTHLYRIAQEAISNSIRHGRANAIDVSLIQANGDVELAIADNGSGFPKQKKNGSGMGMRIMKFRAGMIGGTIDLGGSASGGAVVLCRFRGADAPAP